jgi:hypothetical protein
MKLNQKSGATIAMTAAALLVSGTLATSAFAAGSTEGHCVGANACKGQSACKTAQNDCKGLNACKGKGYLVMTEDECAKAGGTFEG